MAKTTLVEADIALGRRVVEALDKTKFKSSALFWLYMPEAETWRFVIATRIVDDEGPLKAYSSIQKVLRDNHLVDELPLRQIWAASPKKPLIQAIRKLVRTGNGISGIRLSNNYVNGVFIEEAFVYRVK